MTATPSASPPATWTGARPPLAAGCWRVDPDQSYAAFGARIAGGQLRGSLPLAGQVLIGQPAGESSAWLTARARCLSTGSAVLDGLLTGPGFLDAGAFPEITFRAGQLTSVPGGWRASGQLQVRSAEHALVCQLGLAPASRQPGGPGVTVISRWALDARWVTRQRIPGLRRRITMTCSITLSPAS